MPLSVTGDEPKPVCLLSATENVSLASFQSLFIGHPHGSLLRVLPIKAVDILIIKPTYLLHGAESFLSS